MLEAYHKKRDFRKTAEPSGKPGKRRKKRARDGFFAIQKHDATRLHYDLRLACDGVLKSWAVPKGPSLNPADKRLAIQTEDHPLEYGEFEGTIPKGEYGGGTVMLWDRGSFESVDGDPCRALEKGKLKFRLNGEKLRGGFELVRTRNDPDKPQWLLIKLKDEAAQSSGKCITETHTESVATGRSLEAIAAGKIDEDPTDLKRWLSELPKAVESASPPEIRPQLATLIDKPPAGDRWLHEIKWDGYRLIAEKKGQQVRLWTRQRKNWTEKFAAIASALEALPLDSFALDGEVVALDSRGRSDFQKLQNAIRDGKRAKLIYYCFDLPYAAGVDLRAVPLERRKEALQRILELASEDAPLRYSDHLEGAGDAFFQHACEIELEGIIAKRRNAGYASTRNRDWLKIKCIRRQEFVVCGYTPPSGSRRHFGSLALAVRENDAWRYAGQVGTGFNQTSLRSVYERLKPLERKTPPLPASELREVPKPITWTRPEVVVEVAYTEMTDSGRLRHPSFKGMREDKAPEDSVIEKPVAAKSVSPNNTPSGKRAQAKKPASEADLSPPKNSVVAGVRISNPTRKVYPDVGLTKAELAVYYERVAPRLLPHLARRPLSLLRCPGGVEKPCFFQKHFKDNMPSAVNQVAIDEKRGKQPYSYVTDAAGIVALVQFGVFEFHPWGSRIDKLERPDNLIFDLDPDEGVSWKAVLEATFVLRAFLSELGLKTFLKVSGGKGLHVCLPIDRRTDWDSAKEFCHNVALRLAERDPARWIAQASKAKRKGKVFLDYLRNGRGATAVVAYSARARAGAPVAMPIAWEEATEALRPNQWNLKTALARIENEPDPWADFWSTRQSLTRAMQDAVAG